MIDLTEPLTQKWTGDILERLELSIRNNPDSLAAVSSEGNLTYVELDILSSHIASKITQGATSASGTVSLFAARDPRKTGVYAFEARQEPKLAPAETKRFRVAADAWSYFAAQPPGYRRNALHWIVSAKQPATRARRFEQLLADCAARRRLKHLA